MQFAVTVSPTETKIIEAGKDAPRYAQCVWCGIQVVLINIDIWAYYHTSILAIDECKRLRDSGQAELDEVLGVR